MGRYRSYEELTRREKEGRDFRIHLRPGRSGVAVLAPHGGGIEPGTMEIAEAVAGADHTFYCFEGTKARGNAALHLPSERFDEPEGLGLVQAAEAVLAVHGCRGNEEKVYLGGLDRELRDKIKARLARAGFRVEDIRNPRLKGINDRNICNQGRTGRGVQLEVSEGLRKRLFASLSPSGRQEGTALFARLVSALRDCLSRG